MSRYAATRDGETSLHPGRWVGYRCEQVVSTRLLAAAYNPEAYRRCLTGRARVQAFAAYGAARAATFDGPSYLWMPPPGRPRYRWTRDTFAGQEMLRLSVVIYPDRALDNREGTPHG